MGDAVFERNDGFELDGVEDMLDGIVIRVFLPFHVDIDIAGLLCEGIRKIREGETEGFLAAFLKDFGGG